MSSNKKYQETPNASTETRVEAFRGERLAGEGQASSPCFASYHFWNKGQVLSRIPCKMVLAKVVAGEEQLICSRVADLIYCDPCLETRQVAFLHHGLGFLGDEGLHELRGADYI